MDPIMLLWIFLVRGPTQRVRLIHKKLVKSHKRLQNQGAVWVFPLPCVIMMQTLPNVGSAPSREKATAKLLWWCWAHFLAFTFVSPNSAFSQHLQVLVFFPFFKKFYFLIKVNKRFMYRGSYAFSYHAFSACNLHFDNWFFFSFWWFNNIYKSTGLNSCIM